MAVHLPLSQEAQAECRFLLLSPNNLLKPSDGGPVAVPSQDMVLGIYYLTQERPGAIGEGKIFKSVNEAILAYENGVVTLHSRIKARAVSYTHLDVYKRQAISMYPMLWEAAGIPKDQLIDRLIQLAFER